MIKTALLTIGNSPIADAAIRALAKHSHLEYIIYSRKKRKVSQSQRIREYGLLYSLHALIGKICLAFSGKLDPQDYAATEIVVWDDDIAATEILKTLTDVDVVVCCLFNRVLNHSFIESFDYSVNFHPSLLPEYRGPEPIYWGLLNKEQEFGLTLHHMSDRIDEGDVIHQSRCERPRFPLAYLVEKKLANTVDDMVQRFTRQVADGNVAARQQGDGFYLPPPTLKNVANFKSGLSKKSA